VQDRGRAPGWVGAALFLGVTAGVCGVLAQPPPAPATPPAGGGAGDPLVERVRVRVVEVDVVVTDREGRPVAGLGPEDLELRVDGEARPIDYFTAYPLGRAEGVHAAPRDVFLAVVWDGEALIGPQGEQALEAISGALESLLPLVGGMMVARIAERLEVVEPLTVDVERIRAAISTLGAGSAAVARRSRRRSLIAEIERGERPSLAPDGSLQNPGAEDDAISLYSTLLQEAEIDRQSLLARLAQLRGLVRALGGLPGRKQVLYLGAGVDSSPGATAYRLWSLKYGELAPRLGFGREEVDVAVFDLTPDLQRLAAEAAAQRVAIHTLDAGGSRPLRGGADLSSFETGELVSGEARRQLDFLVSLAEGSGGQAALQSSDAASWLDSVRAGLEVYYSLGFTARGDDREMKVRVSARDRDLGVRHGRRMVVAEDRSLERLALATLISGRVDNPLHARVEVRAPEAPAPAEREQGATGEVLPIAVRVPVAELTLLPEGSRHAARLELVVIARSEGGVLSSPFSVAFPFTVDNRNLLLAAAREVEIPLRLAVGPGRMELALAIHDAVGGRTATVLVSSTDDPSVVPLDSSSDGASADAGTGR
jgi:VWFA-related protein